MFAVKAKIYGVPYNPSSSVDFFEPSSSPGLATQLWSDGCVASGVYFFRDIAKV